MVHFLGKTKPWSYTYDPKARQIAGSVHEATTHPTFLLDWWTLFSSAVVPMMQEQFGDQPFHSGCVEVNGNLSFWLPTFLGIWTVLDMNELIVLISLLIIIKCDVTKHVLIHNFMEQRFCVV